MRFEEVPVVKKPGKRATAEDWRRFYQARKRHNLSAHFVQTMPLLRAALNQAGGASKQLVLAVDGSFCNRTVFAASVPGIELIARTRKDAVLWQGGAKRQPLRLFVLAPTPYRKSQSRKLY